MNFQRTKKAIKWSFGSAIITNLLRPLTFVLLANFITAEDFGVFSAAVMVISLTQMIFESSIAKTVVQLQEKIIDVLNVSFWISLVSSIFVMLTVFIFADSISKVVFQNTEVTQVLKIMSLSILLSGLSSVPSALLQKQLNYKKLFYIKFLSIGVPGIISICLAYLGYGYWALVFGILVGQLIQTVIVWMDSKWKPNFSFCANSAKDVFSFAKWVSASGFLAWVFEWLDSFFVAMFLGIYYLGLFRFSKQIINLIFGVFTTAILPVLYATFSENYGKSSVFKNKLLLINKLLMLILTPLGMGLFLLKDTSIPFLFGEKWSDACLIVGIISISSIFSYSVSVNQEAIRATGRSDIETKIMIISTLIRIPIYFFTIKFGLVPFLLGRLSAQILGVCNHMMFYARYLGISGNDYFKYMASPILASTIMFILGQYGFIPLLGKLDNITYHLLLISLCSISYGVVIYCLEKKVVSALIRDLPLFLKD
jgi:O-antigen/teichoic acid export membrane protein